MLLFFYEQQESNVAIELFTRVIFILSPLSNVSEDDTPLYKEYDILYILNKPWKPTVSSICRALLCYQLTLTGLNGVQFKE